MKMFTAKRLVMAAVLALVATGIAVLVGERRSQ